MGARFLPTLFLAITHTLFLRYDFPTQRLLERLTLDHRYHLSFKHKHYLAQKILADGRGRNMLDLVA